MCPSRPCIFSDRRISERRKDGKGEKKRLKTRKRKARPRGVDKSCTYHQAINAFFFFNCCSRSGRPELVSISLCVSGLLVIGETVEERRDNNVRIYGGGTHGTQVLGMAIASTPR